MALDINALLQDSRAALQIEPQEDPEVQELDDSVGLIFKKNTDSPEFKWILPFRTESLGEATFVLIGEYRLEVRIQKEGRTKRAIARKRDFDSRTRIRNAAVLPCSQSTEPEQTQQGSRGEDLLLLTLDSRELLFMRLIKVQNEQYGWDVYSQSLPIGPQASLSGLEVLGSNFVADSAGRAIAIASTSGQLWVTNTTNLPGIENLGQVCNGIVYFDANMTILHMSFLQSTGEYESTVHLLLIGFDEEKAKNLGIPTMLIPLDNVEFPGSFILTSTQSILVFGNIYGGHLQEMDRLDVPSSTVGHETSGGGRQDDRKLLVSWSKPRQKASKTSEEVYMMQDDGALFCVTIESSGSQLLVRQIRDVLSCAAGSSFSCLAPTSKHLNPLCIIGDCRDGLFCSILKIAKDTRTIRGGVLINETETIKLETFPTWAPFTDSTVVRTRSPMASDTLTSDTIIPTNVVREDEAHSTTVIAASGRLPQGRLLEIRRGLTSNIQSSIELFGLVGADKVWLFQLYGQGGTSYIATIVSIPTGTVFLSSFHDNPIELDEQTLATSITTDDEHNYKLHLITRGYFQSADISSISNAVENVQREPLGLVTAATRHTKRQLFYYVISTNEGSQLWSISYNALKQLQVPWPVKIESLPTSEVISITAVDTSLGSQLRDDDKYIVITTITCDVLVLQISKNNTVNVILNHNFDRMNNAASPDICESTVLHTYPQAQRAILSCGMRNGTVKSLLLNWDDETQQLTIMQNSQISFGNSTASLTADINVKAATLKGMFVLCESRLSYVSFDENIRGEPMITPVILQGANGAARPNQQIACFTQALAYHELMNIAPSETAGPSSQTAASKTTVDLCCVSDEAILQCTLDLQPDSLPTIYPWTLTPSRIIHSSQMNQLVVASIREEIDTKRNLKALFPVIHLVTLSTNQDATTASQTIPFSSTVNAHIPPTVIWAGEPGERITALTDWFPLKGGERREFVVAGIMRTHDDGSETGALKYIRLTKTSAGYVSAGRDQESAERAPVLALCWYGRDAILYCADRSIRQRTFDSATSRFDKKNLHTLNSRGLHISTHNEFIIVSTASHSVCVLRFHGGELIPLINHDEARTGLHHLALPSSPFVLATDKLRGLVGLRIPPPPHTRTGARALFDVKMPCSIARLYIANTRPYTFFPASKPAGVLKENIHGLGADGSAYTFAILSQDSWRLLRFVQNLITRTELYAWRKLDAAAAQHLEPASKRATDFSIDAGILHLLLDSHEPASLLQTWLDEQPGSGSLSHGSSTDFASAADRKERFRELVKLVLQSEDDMDLDLDCDDTQVLVEVLRYIRSVLAVLD